MKYGPPALAVDGIPLWIRSENKSRVKFQIPLDFSVLPGPNLSTIRALTQEGWQPIWLLRLARPKGQPSISAVLPERLWPGEKVALVGGNLNGGRLLLNGEPVKLLEFSTSRMVFTLPDSLKPGTGVNLLWERGEGLDYERIAPIILTVEEPIKK